MFEILIPAKFYLKLNRNFILLILDRDFIGNLLDLDDMLSLTRFF